MVTGKAVPELPPLESKLLPDTQGEAEKFTGALGLVVVFCQAPFLMTVANTALEKCSSLLQRGNLNN